MHDLLIIGCGDIGRRVAALAIKESASVTGLIRSAEKAPLLEQQGIRVVNANLDEPSSLSGLPAKGTIVFYLAPPPGGGHVDTRVRNFCGAIAPGEEPTKVVYMSTSGVYGDCSDEWVTEDTPPNPQTARGKRRLDAETVLTAWGKER
ncbi:MAG TPA: NAD(P)H-binding protein [Geobacteraceae bacterium]